MTATAQDSMRLIVGAFAVLLLVLIARPSAANRQVGVAGGAIRPWDGNTGFSVHGHILVKPGQAPWRFGGEFEFRDYESEFFDVSNVDIQSYKFSFLWDYLLKTDGIKPYLGLGLSLAVNVIDEDEIEAEKPGFEVSSAVGFGTGAFALLGIEVPFGDRVSVFAEGRLGADIQLSDAGDIDVENLGGVSGIGGIRLSF